MIELGYSALRGQRAVELSLDTMDVSTAISVENAVFNQFYINADPSFDTTDGIPDSGDWDRDTILNAEYQESLAAGNVSFSVDDIQSVRIKRAEANTYNWITLNEIPISEEEDLNFTEIDTYARGDWQYHYAIVPVMNDGNEGVMNTATVTSKFNGLWICEQGQAYNALLDLEMSTTLNQVTSSVVAIGKRYPYVNKYGKANYYTGSFSATFIYMDPDNCDLDMDNAVYYREQFESFMTDGKAKIIKHEDGRIWLAYIVDEITKDESDRYWLPVQNINFVEIGKYNSSKDLYAAGLIPVNIDSEVVDDEL